MKTCVGRVWRFLASEEGPTAVEYAVMVALVILVCLAAINTLGGRTQGLFQRSATSLPPS